YRIKITPLHTSNIGVGNYIGQIQGHNAYGSFLIPVNYNVTEDVGVDFGNSEINFAMDENFINFQASESGVFFEIMANIRTFGSDGSHEETPLEMKVPVFKGKGSFNIGRIVQRKIHPEDENFLLNGTSPRPAEISFLIYKKLFENQQIIGTPLNFSMKFVAGRTPKVFHNFGLLAPVVFAKRITKNSIEYFNFASKSNSTVVNSYLYRNDELMEGTGDSLVFGAKYINSIAIPFRDYDIVEGDQIEHRINLTANLPGVLLSQKYICFPEDIQSTHIVWMDDYKLRLVFEFT